MASRKEKKFAIIAIIFLVLLIFSPFIAFIFPVKFVLDDIPHDDERDFIVVSFHSQHNNWIEVGDRTGLFLNDDGVLGGYDRPVIIEGSNPREQVSMEIWLPGTLFIVYGTTLTDEYAAENYDFFRSPRVIRSTGWDILGEIQTLDRMPRFSQRYLTIYDFRWMDYVLLFDTDWL